MWFKKSSAGAVPVTRHHPGIAFAELNPVMKEMNDDKIVNELNTSTAASKSTYPWIVVTLLWGVALLNYMDRQMLSTMKPSMMIDIAEL